MLRYIRIRLLAMIPVLIGMSILVFVMMRLIPGDAAVVFLGTKPTPEAVAAFRHKAGLDKPIYVQYFDWVGRLARGDLGTSLTTGTDIGTELTNRLPITLELTLLAILIAIVIAVPLGVVAALRHNTAVDLGLTSLGMVGLSLPNFWLGTMLVLFLSVKVQWFPPGGFIPFSDDPLGNLKSMALPAISLGVVSASVIMRMTRSSMLEVVRQDYVRTARAKGLTQGLITRRHLLKNALIPVITVAGMEVGYIFGGAFLIEAVFYLPGIATYALLAVNQRDYPVLQTVVLLVTVVFMLINLAVDLLYTWLDPRLRIQ
ncbi:MAG TPA: ABC transporter permease [Thermomicrobiales bacterium]|nr:ABC transporter permease [Thermomicrobiales bacterium]